MTAEPLPSKGAKPAVGVGIDAGGTQTRWAAATLSGEIVAEGIDVGLTALQMTAPSGREHLQQVFRSIAGAVAPKATCVSVVCGMTGYDGGSGEGSALVRLIADAFGATVDAVTIRSDLEIAYLDAFRPGEGYIVYAGTGSIAAFIDGEGLFHRTGGRGVILDDAGGGFWIAREALRHIWRAEDERPGSWRESVLAVRVFAQLGGSEWTRSREFVYAGDRGAMGMLAIAVAAAARDGDAVALAILQSAGQELARLARAMITRFGERPIVLAGRVAALHPLIADSMRDSLPENVKMTVREGKPHYAAARIAGQSIAPTTKSAADA